MQDNSEIARLLKKKRIEAGLTQAEVAEMLGYTSSQFISNWERGLAKPPAFMLKSLAKIYKMDAKVLLDMLLESVTKNIEREFHRSHATVAARRRS